MVELTVVGWLLAGGALLCVLGALFAARRLASAPPVAEAGAGAAAATETARDRDDEDDNPGHASEAGGEAAAEGGGDGAGGPGGDD